MRELNNFVPPPSISNSLSLSLSLSAPEAENSSTPVFWESTEEEGEVEKARSKKKQERNTSCRAEQQNRIMKPQIQLLGVVQSRAFRCLWMLEELGLPYQFIYVRVY